MDAKIKKLKASIARAKRKHKNQLLHHGYAICVCNDAATIRRLTRELARLSAPSQSKWEIVHTATRKDDAHVTRLPVPGGWLYTVSAFDYFTNSHFTTTFVPEEKR